MNSFDLYQLLAKQNWTFYKTVHFSKDLVIENLTISLPNDYIEFMDLCGGGEGLIGGIYLTIFNPTTILERSKKSEITKFFKNCLVFGSGDACDFLIEFKDSIKYYAIPSGSPFEDEKIFISNSFREFLEMIIFKKYNNDLKLFLDPQ